VTDVGAFSPEVAAEVLQVVRRLQASGLLDRGRGAESQQPKPPTIWIQNNSGEEIPAFACMQATGTDTSDDRTYVLVDKPADATGEAGGFLFNGPRPVPIGKRGVAYAGPHVRALSDGTAISAGDRMAPQASSWEVTTETDGIFTGIGSDSVATDVVRMLVYTPPTLIQQVVTDIRVDSTNLQYKTRDVLIFPDGDESAWTTWHAGEDCTT